MHINFNAIDLTADHPEVEVEDDDSNDGDSDNDENGVDEEGNSSHSFTSDAISALTASWTGGKKGKKKKKKKATSFLVTHRSHDKVDYESLDIWKRRLKRRGKCSNNSPLLNNKCLF